MTHNDLVSWIRDNADQLAAFFLGMPGFATIAYKPSEASSHATVASTLSDASGTIVAASGEETAIERRRRLTRERTRRWRERRRLESVRIASHAQVSLGSVEGCGMGSKRGECEGGESGEGRREERTPFFASQHSVTCDAPQRHAPPILSQNQGSSVTGASPERHTASPSVTDSVTSRGDASPDASLFVTPASQQDKPPKKKGYYANVPDELLSPKFGTERQAKLWQEWVDYRKAKAKPSEKVTPRGVQLWIRTFREILVGGDDALAEAVRRAIENNWTGLYPASQSSVTKRHAKPDAPATWTTEYRPDLRQVDIDRVKASRPQGCSTAMAIWLWYETYIGKYSNGRAQWLKHLKLGLAHYGVDAATIEKVVERAEKSWPET